MKTAPRHRATPFTDLSIADVWIPLAAAAVATIAFWNSLHYGLAQDAFTWIGRTRGLIPHTTGLWRTLSYDFYYATLDRWFGLSGLPYHVVGLTLHAANAALFAALALRLGLSRAAGFAAAMFYAAHYAHFDAVFVVASISEPMAAFFVLLSLWIALPPPGVAAGWRRAAGATLAFAAALLSKETVVLYPAVLWGVTRARPGAARAAVLPCAALSALYLVMFFVTDPVGGLSGANVYEAHWDAGLLASWATYAAWAMHLLNLRSTDLGDRVASHPEGWLVTAMVAFLLFDLWRSRRKEPGVGPAWQAATVGATAYTAFIAPVLPLLEHAFHLYLYLPLVGFGWVLAAAWDAWVPRPARGLAWLLGAALAVLGILTVRRIEELPMRDTGFAYMGSVRRAVTAEKILRGLARETAALPESLAMVGPDAVASPADRDTTELGAFLFNDVAGALNEGTAIRLRFPEVRHVEFFGDLGPWLRQPDITVFDHQGNVTRGPSAWLFLRRAEAEWNLGRVSETAASMARARAMTDRWIATTQDPWRRKGLEAIHREALVILDRVSRAPPPGDLRALAKPSYLRALAEIAESTR